MNTLKTIIPILLTILATACAGPKGSEGATSTPNSRKGNTTTEGPAAPEAAPVTAAASSSYTAPGTTDDGKGGLKYVNPPLYTPQNTANVRPGFASPEAAVVHFYASLLRKDNEYKSALAHSGITIDGKPLSERSLKRLTRKVNKVRGWTHLSFSLVSKTEQYGQIYIKIRTRVEINGREDGGTDDVTVIKAQGRYWLLGVPS